MKHSKEVEDALFGDPFAGLASGKPVPYDGRTAALSILRKYLSEITFYRQGGKDSVGTREPPIAFQVPLRDIHVEWPEDEAEMNLPAIALLAQSPANYQTPGLVTNVIEDSRDKYGDNTVLNVEAAVDEIFLIELWCKTKQERRGLKKGIEEIMSPLQQMSGLRFVMPDYYDRLATFVVQSYEVVDDEMATYARRKGKFLVQLTYLQVVLVEVPPMLPVTEVNVSDSGDSAASDDE